jgi:hypothetical protein
VPTGIATDDNTKDFFRALMTSRTLASLYDFENAKPLFPAVHRSFKISLLSIAGRSLEKGPDFAFYLHDPADLADHDRHFSLRLEDLEVLNANTGTCPTFRSRRDARINLGIYQRVGILWREDEAEGNPWGLRFMQGIFNMASDSALFRTANELDAAGWTLRGNHYHKDDARMSPLVEAKMVHHYDHRFGSYEGQSDKQANQALRLPVQLRARLRRAAEGGRHQPQVLHDASTASTPPDRV